MLNRRNFMTAMMAGVAITAGVPAIAATVPDDGQRMHLALPNRANGQHYIGHDAADFVAVVMGFVPLHHVRECRLSALDYDAYVTNREMPAILAEYEPDLTPGRRYYEYRAVIDEMLAMGMVKTNGLVPSDTLMPEGYLEDKVRFITAEASGRRQFDLRQAKRLAIG